MCQRLVTLASDGAGHRIAQCEHGTIHLFWVRGSILLIPEDLLKLYMLLEAWQPEQAFLEHEGFILRRMASGDVQIWCACVGLLMNREELKLLYKMLWYALSQMNLMHSNQQPCQRHWSDEYQTLIATPTSVTARN